MARQVVNKLARGGRGVRPNQPGELPSVESPKRSAELLNTWRDAIVDHDARIKALEGLVPARRTPVHFTVIEGGGPTIYEMDALRVKVLDA